MVPLVTGLGGAVIGAVVAVYVPARQRRDQARQEERSLQESLLREEIRTLTHLRTTGWAWLQVLLRAHQSLQGGLDLDLTRFDDENTKASFKSAFAGYTRMSLPTTDPELERLSAEIFDELQDLSRRLRERIVAGSRTEQGVPDSSGQIDRIRELRAALNVKLLERIEQISRQLL
ncbi:hypothetical protein CGL27_29485 [Streptomyces sp. 11-1-2]|nr:hypothetical protein CGL27_29485 [Streptomyces sp. 11-1-2]